MKMKKFIVSIMCALMVFSTVTVYNSTEVEAKATKAAVKYLKGTWHTWDAPGYKVKFTKKYVKYYDDADKNFNQLPTNKLGKMAFKSKIASTKKKDGKWVIKVKGSNGTYYFRTSDSDKNILEYMGDINDIDTYSGSSSLEKIR